MAERSNFSKEKRKKNKQESELASMNSPSSVEKDFGNKNMQIKKKRKIADSKMVEKRYTMQTRSQSRRKKVFGNKNMSIKKLAEKKFTVKTKSHSRRQVAGESKEKKDITVLEDEVVCPENSTNVEANVPELVVTHSAEGNTECSTTILEMESIYNEEVTGENEEKNDIAVLEDEVVYPEDSTNVKVKLAELVVAHSAEVDRECSTTISEIETISSKEVPYLKEEKRGITVLEDEIVWPEDSTNMKANVPELVVTHSTEVNSECSTTILEMETISNKEVTGENEEKNDITVLKDEVLCPEDSANVKVKLADLVVAHSAEVDRKCSTAIPEMQTISNKEVADESEGKSDITVWDDEVLCPEDSTNVKAKVTDVVVAHSAEVDMKCATTILEMESISNEEEAGETKEEILKSLSLEKVFRSKHSSTVRIEFPRVGVSPTPEVDMEDSMIAIEPSKSDVKEKDHGRNEGDKSGSYPVSSDVQEMGQQVKKEN